MRQAGEVTYADAHKGRKNEGVIEFKSYSDMKRALDKLDGTEVNGRRIRLVEDRPSSRRRRSYSRSRSRSRYLKIVIENWGAVLIGMLFCVIQHHFITCRCHCLSLTDTERTLLPELLQWSSHSDSHKPKLLKN